MRSIEANYKNIQVSNPNLAAYPCLARAITGREFSRRSLITAFKRIVPSDDYSRSETKELIDNLESLTNMPEEGKIRPKSAL